MHARTHARTHTHAHAYAVTHLACVVRDMAKNLPASPGTPTRVRATRDKMDDRVLTVTLRNPLVVVVVFTVVVVLVVVVVV